MTHLKPYRILIAILGIFLIAAGCSNLSLLPRNIGLFQKVGDLRSITIGTESLRVETMDSDAERAQGLSGRSGLPPTQGMLFDFTNSTERKPNFWMKDMQFAIDIIWIKDNQVVGITKNVQPPLTPDYLPTYPAPREIDYVLEVNANWAELHGVQKGTPLQL